MQLSSETLRTLAAHPPPGAQPRTRYANVPLFRNATHAEIEISDLEQMLGIPASGERMFSLRELNARVKFLRAQLAAKPAPAAVTLDQIKALEAALENADAACRAAVNADPSTVGKLRCGLAVPAEVTRAFEARAKIRAQLFAAKKQPSR